MYPEIDEIFADGQTSLSTMKAFHTAVAELTAADKHLTVRNLLKAEIRQIRKLQPDQKAGYSVDDILSVYAPDQMALVIYVTVFLMQ